MDWKAALEKAFPKKAPANPYTWPKLKPPSKGPAGSYPALKPVSKAPAASYPQLQKSGPGPGSTLPALDRDDHWGDFAWKVEIEGVAAGRFSKVEGLNIQIETIEYQNSNDMTPRKRPGRIKVDNVRLVKGFVNTPVLYNWCDTAMKGDVPRKSVSLVLLGDDHATELCRYNLFDVWPCKWSSFKLDGKGNSAMVEEIELVVESLARA